jgi:cytochrome c oxidase cbb3-type subunit III
MRTSINAFVMFLAACTAGCGPAPGYPPQPVARPENITDFSTLYSQNCAGCHGANGQNGPAIDLANPEYQALVDDALLRKSISSGMPGTEMPAFAQSAGGMLTDVQVNALIAGMRQAWLRPNIFAGATPPAYTQAATGDSTHGRQVYASRCAGCHNAAKQDITSPDYLSLVSDQALRSIIVAGRPDIGQPDWRHDGQNSSAPLSAQEVDNIIAYLASLRTPAQASTTSPTQTAPAQPATAKASGR